MAASFQLNGQAVIHDSHAAVPGAQPVAVNGQALRPVAGQVIHDSQAAPAGVQSGAADGQASRPVSEVNDLHGPQAPPGIQSGAANGQAAYVSQVNGLHGPQVAAQSGAASGQAAYVSEPPAGPSSQVLAEFRDAFSHLQRQGEGICGWLTASQQAALAMLFQSRGLKPKQYWQPSELWDATDREIKMIEEFRLHLERQGRLKDEHARAYCHDLTLLRYIRARDHQLGPAHHMLLNSLAWRAEHKPWAMENVASKTNKMSSDARVVGLDPQGCIVIYSSFANTKDRSPANVTMHTVTMMEKSMQCVAAKTPGQVIWVNNFCGKHKRGFGWSDASPRFAFAGLGVFLDHYPECLKTMIVVDPPGIFFRVWKMIKPLLPIKTQQKGEFVDSKAPTTRLHFIKMFGEELADFLLARIAEDNKAP